MLHSGAFARFWAKIVGFVLVIPAALTRVFARFWAKIVALVLVIPAALTIAYHFTAIPYFAAHTWEVLLGPFREQRDVHPPPEPATLVQVANLFPDRVSALPGLTAQRVSNGLLYPRGAEIRLNLYHQGPKPAVVTHIRPLVDIVAPTTQMAYDLDPGHTVALGQVQPSIYYVRVGRAGVIEAFESIERGRVNLNPEDLLSRAGTPTEIRLAPTGDVEHSIIVRVRAEDPGVYRVRFAISYEVQGRAETVESEGVQVYERE